MSYLPGSTCAVSVVIPIYNAAEYIGECLDSLLIQTFQDFEVIVVDDCSTDNSVEVVESYIDKFNGRLQTAKTKKNSGGGGYVPRNIGIKLAHGEYISFIDSDDFIMPNTLETLYAAAKENTADVVYVGAYYDMPQPNEVRVLRDDKGNKLFKDGKEDKPSLIADAPKKNLDAVFIDRHIRAPWTKLVRREFLLENEILFPKIIVGGDFVWMINVYCHAKRLFRLPTPFYFYRRYSSVSVSTNKNGSTEQLYYVITAFVAFMKALMELANETEILRQNPFYVYQALESDFKYRMDLLGAVRKQLKNQEIYETLCRDFNQANGSLNLLVPFLFSAIDADRRARIERLTLIEELKAKVNKLKARG